jgi:ribonuclease VapC
MLANYWHEPGYERVEALISSTTDECWMSLINLGETYYRIAKEDGQPAAERAQSWAGSLGIRFARVPWSMIYAAVRLKATYPLSYADCFAAALAQRLGATVVTGDPEFHPLEDDGLIAVDWLPRPRI